MKTKSLEKLTSFELKNKKLATVLGGQGGPAAPTLSISVGETTGGGTISFPEEGGCVCYSYTSDVDLPGGGRGYNGSQRIDLPC